MSCAAIVLEAVVHQHTSVPLQTARADSATAVAGPSLAPLRGYTHLIVPLHEALQSLGGSFEGGRNVASNDKDILVALAQVPVLVPLPTRPRLYPVRRIRRRWTMRGAGAGGLFCGSGM